MIFILFVVSFILGGAGGYLLINSPEQQVLGWSLIGGGVLLLLLTIFFYLAQRGKKRGRNDCLDCSYMDLPVNCFDCDGKPDCDWNCH